MVILRLALLLYTYYEHMEKEITARLTLRDHIGMTVNAIVGVRHIDLRGWHIIHVVLKFNERTEQPKYLIYPANPQNN